MKIILRVVFKKSLYIFRLNKESLFTPAITSSFSLYNASHLFELTYKKHQRQTGICIIKIIQRKMSLSLYENAFLVN